MAMSRRIRFLRYCLSCDFVDVSFHSGLVELVRIPLDYPDGVLWALAKTGTQPVAKVIGS